ncbi:prophage tail fiber N-terminal domain-containing protein [Salmonella enterica]
MSVLISGALIDGAGIPMPGCHIILKSLVNTNEVVMGTVSDVVAGNNGEYSFEAQTGKYSVSLRWQNEYYVGEITVYPDSQPGSLNDFLMALSEEDLKPDVVARFEEMVAQAQQSAGAAAGSAQEAGKHAADVEQAKEYVKTLAGEVEQNAAAVAGDRNATAEAVKRSEENVQASERSSMDAAASATKAEQARNDIDTALADTLKTTNYLSEIADEGGDAQQESRDNLGLKSAATMEPQTDIRDRTEGRLALPGAFGFGKLFTYRDRLEFRSEEDFLNWLKTATPGHYNVYGGDKIIPGVLFSGDVEIIWPDALAAGYSPASQTKLIFFRGSNGNIYFNRYWSAGSVSLIGWENLKLKIADFIRELYSTAGSNTTGNPGVGGLILAAYQGTGSGDTAISLTRGYSYPGSSLTVVSISVANNRDGVATATPTITTRGCSGWSLPGVYTALNGASGNAKGAAAQIGLFIRVA